MNIRLGRAKFKIECVLGPAGKWYHRVLSVNGEPVYTSEVYETQQSCRKTALSVAKNAGWECWVYSPEAVGSIRIA